MQTQHENGIWRGEYSKHTAIDFAYFKVKTEAEKFKDRDVRRSEISGRDLAICKFYPARTMQQQSPQHDKTQGNSIVGLTGQKIQGKTFLQLLTCLSQNLPHWLESACTCRDLHALAD
jgi:hypothetical protein